MRYGTLLAIASSLLCGSVAYAPTSTSATPALQFENVTIGEPMTAVRERLGDPIKVTPLNNGQQVWRYLEHDGAIFVDVLVKQNAAYSVTVVRRFTGSPYTDSKGISFGMTSDQVKTRLGSPTRVSTNSDDGSVDLWYYSTSFAWIYEFYADKLGFIQIIVSPAVAAAFAAAPPVEPADGSSLERAIRIRPSSFLGNNMWIDAYLAMNICGQGGHWKEVSSTMREDPSAHDLMGYTVVHGQCSDGTSERDFFFDTHGMLATSSLNKSQTIYVDVSQMNAVEPKSTNKPSSAPAHGGTSFSDAVVISATTEASGVKAEQDYLIANACAGGTWNVTGRKRTVQGSHAYDILSAVCTAGSSTRDFYFDIGEFYKTH